MLKIYRPLLSNRINQEFGDNNACIDRYGKIVNANKRVCPANTKPFYKSIGMNGHNGIDFDAFHGEPVFHAGDFDGWMKTEKDSAGGIGVDVISNEKQTLADGSKSYVKLRYWHLKTPVGFDGKQVTLGAQIGMADNTGSSSGDHLHFGLKRCDKKGNALDGNNGYNGAIDPMPYSNLAIDAKTQSIINNIPPAPLSPQEVKEVQSQLTLWIRIINLCLEIKRRL